MISRGKKAARGGDWRERKLVIFTHNTTAAHIPRGVSRETEHSQAADRDHNEGGEWRTAEYSKIMLTLLLWSRREFPYCGADLGSQGRQEGLEEVLDTSLWLHNATLLSLFQERQSLTQLTSLLTQTGGSSCS